MRHKLVKVWRKDGQEEWVLIHVEVQSQEESDFAQRTYVYNYRVFDRYNRTVVNLAVLGAERRNWRPSRFGYNLWGRSVDFAFPIVKLLDHASALPALETSTNPFAAVVLAHLKTQETSEDPLGRLDWKKRIVKGLYDRGWPAKIEQGLREGLLLGIELSLKRRFPASAHQLMTEISQIIEVEKLRAILIGVETAASPDELRRLWS